MRKILAHLEFDAWTLAALVLTTLVFFYPLMMTAPSPQGEEDRFCRQALDLLHQGDIDHFLPLLNPAIQTEIKKVTDGPLQQMFAKTGKPIEVHPYLALDYQDPKTPSQGRSLQYYVDYEKAAEVVEFVVHPEGKGYLIDGFHFTSVGLSFQENMRFNLRKRSIFQLLFLLLAYGMALLCAATMVACLKSTDKTPLRKAFWVAALLVGTLPVHMVWLPAPWYGAPLSFWTTTVGKDWKKKGVKLEMIKFPISGFKKMPLHYPWTVFICIPIGMISYYSRLPGAKGQEREQRGPNKRPRLEIGRSRASRKRRSRLESDPNFFIPRRTASKPKRKGRTRK